MASFLSCWAPMVPIIKERLGLSEAVLGTALLGMGGGALAAMPLSAIILHKFGTRNVIPIASFLLCVIMPLLSLATSPMMLTATLFCFSLVLGTYGVAIHTQAIEINKLTEKPVLSRINGMYSIGTLTGALVLTTLLKAGLPLITGAGIVSLILLIIVVTQKKGLLVIEPTETTSRFSVYELRGKIILLGIVCFILFMAEGSVLDWSAVLLRDYRGFKIENAGLGYSCFAVAMTLSRFIGDKAVISYGQNKVVSLGLVLAVVGFLLSALVPLPIVALTGFTLIGFGLANSVPILFGASNNISSLPPQIVLPIIITFGCSGTLIGPVALGQLAHFIGLDNALAGFTILLFIVIYCTKYIIKNGTGST